MDYPLWFVDLENYEPGDENIELVELLLDVKENMKLRRRVDKEGVFTYISIKRMLNREEELTKKVSLPTYW